MVEAENRTTKTNKEQNLASYGGEFESYLISALNDSLIKKSKLDFLSIMVTSSSWF